ncbi:unnamed protein product [Amoebophrya sp. A25]|nr:unnamed protein product [Amoebophrya sp. A25]|eukprot:GSA25T00017153001.1
MVKFLRHSDKTERTFKPLTRKKIADVDVCVPGSKKKKKKKAPAQRPAAPIEVEEPAEEQFLSQAEKRARNKALEARIREQAHVEAFLKGKKQVSKNGHANKAKKGVDSVVVSQLQKSTRKIMATTGDGNVGGQTPTKVSWKPEVDVIEKESTQKLMNTALQRVLQRRGQRS